MDASVKKTEASLKRLFYPLVILLFCLPRACKYPYKTRRRIDQPPSSTSPPEDIFRIFVSRLAFLFWTDTSPATISACAVLQCFDDTVEYAFAFNNRSASKLKGLKEQIESILGMFRHPHSSDERKREILRNVLLCNSKRVRCYLRTFKRRLSECIDACSRGGSDDAIEISPCLQSLLDATTKALTTTDQRVLVDTAATEQLIWSVYSVYKSPVFEPVQARVRTEERYGSTEYWTELIHVAGRLMTYKQAIDVSFRVRETWPELFENFQVTMVPSSPERQVLNPKVMTAKDIINKTSSDAPIVERLYTGLENLGRDREKLLDEEIKQQWSKKPKGGFSVHAEITLLLYLEQSEGGTEESRFFQGIKFIGSSKPPCKLCWYFFQEYPTDVEVRSSHMNLYPWVMPSILDGEPGDTRPKVVHRIKDRLRTDLIKALTGGERDGRPHDSSNYSTRRGPPSHGQWEEMSVRTEVSSASRDTEADDTDSIYRSSPSTSSDENAAVVRYTQAQPSIDDLSLDLNSLSLQPRPLGLRTAAAATGDGSYHTTDGRETVDDDDGGGTLLFHGRRNLQTRTRTGRT